jgi:hypothetical protein
LHPEDNFITPRRLTPYTAALFHVNRHAKTARAATVSPQRA